MLRLFAGMLLETLIAGLMAPVVMLTQTIDVAAILLGRDSGLERAAARRRCDPGARDAAAVSPPHGAWRCCSAAVAVAGLAVPGAVDAAGGARAWRWRSRWRC